MITDEARFTDVYRKYYGRVRAYAARRAPEPLAQEATDEAFLIAWKKLDHLPSDPLPWLLVTARHALSEHRRREGRQAALVERMESGAAPDSGTSPGADAAALERLTVLSALGSLSDRDRETLMLTVWDGLTYHQAAAVSGCSTAAFAVRHHRARRRLTSALAAHDGSGTSQELAASNRMEGDTR